ncbi:copper amine oxidase [Paenibacillus sp. 32O-W]|jgi:Copper amine oxidase N-terminal domain.|uniref:copper amine oxidase N-terminal domain-containing protein n=1 Tax=Paenibacillus sp. 32O-W TaxID=1695218 RepID=UPI00071F77BE|nr:copper amine oxidase N-terminal domain-containing protein [Paenibacillus sp. 32O-W]ALS29081.1 copper amine oxidase [Paenibacillus sp. 32O-W]
MKKKLSLVLSGTILAVALVSGAAVASGPIKLFVNGKEIRSDVAPVVEKGRVLVPIRWVAEALGADVKWDKNSQSVRIEDQGGQSASQRLELIERFYAPESAKEAAETWAEAVKQRNGAVQYSLLSPEAQKATIDEFEQWNWVPGVSSPWTDKYTVSLLSSNNKDRYVYTVEFQMKTSTGDAGKGNVEVTVVYKDDRWVITDIEPDPDAKSLPDLVLP